MSVKNTDYSRNQESEGKADEFCSLWNEEVIRKVVE